MELRLLHHYFENFSTPDEKYNFCMEGSMQGAHHTTAANISPHICGGGYDYGHSHGGNAHAR